MFEIKPYPEFSWSLSRHKTLMDCARKYAFEYYLSHNGWLSDSNNIAKHTYRLKKITNLEILFGSTVHNIINQVIEMFLNSNYIYSENELVDRIRNMLNTSYIDSTKRKDLWYSKPTHYTMLHEIYYGENNKLPLDKITEINDRLEVCIKHFYSSKTFSDIQNKKEMKFIEAERFRTMYKENIKIFVVMDFVYKDIRNGKWIIVDWKTGKESFEDRNQLALYAMYLKEKFNIKSIEEITIRNEYLLTGTNREYSLKDIDIKNSLEVFKMSLGEMIKYLEDITINKPIDIDYFLQTNNDSKCIRCNYRELCNI
jgi:CRISPR/Cas system-associated exonuclease Cas4 (RecB family)